MNEIEATQEYFEALKEVYSWPPLSRWAFMVGLWLCQWGTRSGRTAIKKARNGP